MGDWRLAGGQVQAWCCNEPTLLGRKSRTERFTNTEGKQARVRGKGAQISFRVLLELRDGWVKKLKSPRELYKDAKVRS